MWLARGRRKVNRTSCRGGGRDRNCLLLGVLASAKNTRGREDIAKRLLLLALLVASVDVRRVSWLLGWINAAGGAVSLHNLL
jgi:hypothetical protein